MTTIISTDGRALADAATLARKLTDPIRRGSRLTVTDGRAEVETSDGTTAVSEVVGTGSAPDGVRVSIAVDLDGWRKLRTAGPITIRDDGQTITMTAGAVTSTLREAGEVPSWPTFPGSVSPITVDVRDGEAAEVAATLRSVGEACASTGNYRAILGHVALTPGEAAATDTYRLNVAAIPAHADGGEVGLIPGGWVAAIPARGVDRLTITSEDGRGTDAGACELTFRTTTRGRVRRVLVIGRTEAGPFPNYAALIPERDETGTTVTIPTGIRDVVRRMTAPVTMSLAAEEMTLVDVTGSSATMLTTIVVGRQGPAEIALNGAYLADLVDHVGDGARLYVRDGLRAMVADADGRTSLLMPMRA